MENLNIETNEVLEAVETMDVPVVHQGKGIGGKIGVGIGLAALGAIGALVYKNRDKLHERRIKKLEKKGYAVLKVEDDSDVIDIENEDSKTE